MSTFVAEAAERCQPAYATRGSANDCDQALSPAPRAPTRSVVKDALEKLPAERNCYQLIGGTLVPKTVEGVLPQVSATLTNVRVAPPQPPGGAQLGAAVLCTSCSAAVRPHCCPLSPTHLATPSHPPTQLTSVVAGLREELEKAAAARGAFESKHRIKPTGTPAAAAPAASSAAAAPGVLA